jgi:hypothetical protein
MTTDLLGRECSGTETELLEIYTRLKRLLASEDLDPCAAANVRAALSAMWNAVNDLALIHEHLTDQGA